MLAIYLSLLETEAQRDKFEWLYQRYAGLLYQVAFSVVKEHFLAEDVVHETFLILIRMIDEVRTDDPKETAKFLKVIAHNKAIDTLRKLDKMQPWSNDALEYQAEERQTDPESVAINEESFERLVNCVKSMDELYRAPLELRMQGYKITQIAKFLEMNPQTVKVRLYRARKMLLQQLEDEAHGSKEG